MKDFRLWITEAAGRILWKSGKVITLNTIQAKELV
jgi:hypothetical protein